MECNEICTDNEYESSNAVSQEALELKVFFWYWFNITLNDAKYNDLLATTKWVVDNIITDTIKI